MHKNIREKPEMRREKLTRRNNLSSTVVSREPLSTQEIEIIERYLSLSMPRRRHRERKVSLDAEDMTSRKCVPLDAALNGKHFSQHNLVSVEKESLSRCQELCRRDKRTSLNAFIFRRNKLFLSTTKHHVEIKHLSRWLFVV